MSKLFTHIVFTLAVSTIAALSTSAIADEKVQQVSANDSIENYTAELLPMVQRKLNEFDAEIETVKVERVIKTEKLSVEKPLAGSSDESLWAFN
ncbi:hypothetical protein SAMN02745866_03076 [Alteromonadaceae bacterium Bs31]|nr:hypothetical protein SAMN02745866_03076 [Alteromonadaceae bacterium Bs31]